MSVHTLPMPPPRWSRNPFALAELVAGRRIDWRAGNLTAQISTHLRLKPDGVKWRGTSDATLLTVFIEDEWRRKGFDSVDAALAWVRGNTPMLIRDFGMPVLERVLPFLVPVRGPERRPPGVGEGPLSPSALGPAGEQIKNRTGASFLDPVQGIPNDCWLIASMIAVAWACKSWTARVGGAAAGPAFSAPFAWSFFPNDQATFAVAPEVPLAVDPADSSRTIVTGARSNDPGEVWPAIVEKAFAMSLNGAAAMASGTLALDQYAALDNSMWPQDACLMLCGGVSSPGPGQPGDPISFVESMALAQIVAHCDGALTDIDRATLRPMVATTRDEMTVPSPAPLFDKARLEGGLYPNHAFAVLGIARRPADTYVILRNPWSRPISPTPAPGIAYLTGDWEPSSGIRSRHVTLNDEGVFALPLREFVRYFDTVCTVAPAIL